jgi:8-oxo-dGTP pyrophosphatase MutT (NUDIX family)
MQIQRPASKQPIPKHAKKVFKGVLFDVYQWEQKLFDGSTKIFEKVKRRDTVNILPITSDGKILLSEQEQPGIKPFIGSFGGMIDGGESPFEAAKRELLEETGFASDDIILWDAVQPSEKIDWAIYTFIARNCRKQEEQSVDAGEKIKLLYLSFEEFLSIISDEKYRDIEVAIKLLRIMNKKEELDKVKKIFLMK